MMNKTRLLKLAALLEADAKDQKGAKFDLTIWGNMIDLDKPMSCGTVACAMGLAVASGIFKKDGLTNYTLNDGDARLYAHSLIPFYKNESGFHAAAKLFNISYNDANWLFGAEWYPNEVMIGAEGELTVAKRIRVYVKKGKR